MLKVAVVGIGGWGKSHVRVLKLLSAEGLVDELYAVDIDENRLKWAQRVYGVSPLKTLDEAIRADVDAAIIATPTKMHYEHALRLLSAGISLLVEKPFAENYMQTVELLDRSRGVVITTGYVLRFRPAVRCLKENLNKLGGTVSTAGGPRRNLKESASSKILRYTTSTWPSTSPPTRPLWFLHMAWRKTAT
ncbi:MAG: Gfo/Idh/MocA family oxidoreductase [Pyrobaculum sp.]